MTVNKSQGKLGLYSVKILIIFQVKHSNILASGLDPSASPMASFMLLAQEWVSRKASSLP